MASRDGAAEIATWLRALGCPRPAAEVEQVSRRLVGGAPPGGAPLGPPLRFLASRVCSEAHLQRVRRNLALAGASQAHERQGGYSGDEDTQTAEGSSVALRAELERARAEVWELRSCVESDAAELAAAEAARRRSAAATADVEARAALLSSWSKTLDGTAEALRARRATLAAETDAARLAVAAADGRGGEGVACDASEEAAVAEVCSVVEAELQQAVAASCPAYSSAAHFAQLSSSNPPPPCRCSLDDVALPRVAAEAAAAALGSKGAAGVLAGATGVAAAASRRLAAITAELDLDHDAHTLLKGNTDHKLDGDADKENRPGEGQGGWLAAPRALLRLQQQQHVSGFMQTQSARNAATAARRQLEEAGACDGRAHSVARAAGLRAAVGVLGQEKARLSAEAAHAEGGAAELRQKKKLIEAFGARDGCLDKAIATTRHYCLTSGKRLVLDCSALNTRVAEDVVHHTARLQQSAKRMQGVVTKELTDFQNVDLQRIPALAASCEPSEWPQGRSATETSPLLLLQRAELAFMASGPNSTSQGSDDPLAALFAAAMGDGQAALPLRAPDDLLPCVIQRTRGVEDLLSQMGREDTTAARKEVAMHADNAAALLAADETHAAALLQLETSVNEAAEAGRMGIEEAEHGQSMLRDWWEQPALDAVPWVTVDREDGAVRIRPVRGGGCEERKEEEKVEGWTAREWQSHMSSLASQVASG